MAIWSKRGQHVDDWVIRFTVGEDYLWDRHLLPYDARGTRAHAAGLAEIGVLSPEEHTAIDAALDTLDAEIAADRISIRPEDEDAHTVIEAFLTDRLGDTGKRIHTGRSRNDQVLTALRLFLRDGLQDAARGTAALARALCALAETHADALMPGYTHLQRAMPSSVALWALGYAELLAGDIDGLRAAHAALGASPLGSAAGYGVPHLDLPREANAARLGFDGVQIHATTAQLSRGKLEAVAAHAFVQVGATVNRLASDLVLFASAEFGFVRLPERFTTGSSIMPQKRNPDVLELARAHYHRLVAELHLLLTLPANLPSGYHRDLQLTKEAAMRAALLTADVLAAMNALVPELTFDRARMRAALSPDLFATARALELVRAGVPFRDAYRTAADESSAGALSVPTPEAALAAYTADGTPGRVRPDLVRAAIAERSRWAEGG